MKQGNRSRGFTIVEILVVIVILAVLLTLSIVAYQGIQRRSAESSVKSNLSEAAKSLYVERAKNGMYPSALPSSFKASDKVLLTMNSDIGYSGLTPVQNGVLFYEICKDLISEGLGSGVNNGGNTENYLTACTPYSGSVGNGYIQVNGWTPRNFNKPVTSSTLPNLVSSINYNDSWRPNRDVVEKNFFTQLNDRFLEQGGTFPITTFWEPWATVLNGGVFYEALPLPTTGGGGWVVESDFCIQGRYESYSDVLWYVRKNGQPTTGTCPAAP